MRGAVQAIAGALMFTMTAFAEYSAAMRVRKASFMFLEVFLQLAYSLFGSQVSAEQVDGGIQW